MGTDPVDWATEYARLVVADQLPAPESIHDLVGEIMPTCQLVKWAAMRHLADLEHGHERGLRWDSDAAAKATAFFPAVLRHIKGEWAKQRLPIHLELWQHFLVGSLYGWKRADGTRRFRTVYWELPRKNAKSTLCAGLALFGTFFDGEEGAEGYCAATKRDQAKIVWKDAEAMRRKSTMLTKRLGHYKSSSTLYHTRTNSSLVPLGADADTLDGLNPHIVVIDELHAHPNAKVVDVMDTATGARSQPLQVEITTAGHDQTSVCWRHHEHTRRVLDPDSDYEDDAWFGFVATVDDATAWDNPREWAKANPNLGVSVKADDFGDKCARAKLMPTAENPFKQKRLNIWVSASSQAIDMVRWDAGGRLRSDGSLSIDVDELKGRQCWGAFDLARVNDLSAFALVFPPEEEDDHGEWQVLLWFWVPDDDIEMRSDRDRVPYRVWSRQGWIEATPGDVTDFDFIEHRLLQLSTEYDIQEIAFDATFGGQLTTHLMDAGITMVEHRQTVMAMAAPTGAFLRLVHGRKLRHGGNPVLRWNADNLVVRYGAEGDCKPDKAKSREKIDGVVATIMAVGRAAQAQEDDGGPEVSFI